MLTKTAHELEISEQVSFLGYRSNAAACIPGHALYVHSALHENFPLVVVEAMACGLPVVAGAVGGIREAFARGIEGEFWDLQQPQEAARTLISLMENKAKRSAMGKAARQRFLSQFSSQVTAPRLCRFLGLTGY
jgi:glycosyltransferase involved in cell wall biosynthesis